MKEYDSTVARIAGNIASGAISRVAPPDDDHLAKRCVLIARLIVEEVKRTVPAAYPVFTVGKGWK